MRDIYATVLDAPEDRRKALARELCNGDSLLESEMDSLLSAHLNAGSFLGEPAPMAFCGDHRTPRDLKSDTILHERFCILRLLNVGGMGSVYEAWDSELQEIVALKTIRPDIASNPAVIERFKEEVRQARQITHPNICRVYDLFCHDFAPGERIWFLTMQLLIGETLLERLHRKGPLSCKEALPLVEQIASGLTAAHERGIVHRDLKSANVMLVLQADESVSALIADFGLARHAISGAGAAPGQGTPAYVAPEQWLDGNVTPAGDQYSLGVVMCEMITGERPVPPRLEGSFRVPAKLPAGRKIDPQWETAIRRCLDLTPEKRFDSLEDVLAAIDPVRRRKRIARWILTSLGLPHSS